jgi:serine/threonine protein kinase
VLLEPEGTGEFLAVYRAYDTHDDQPVVLKLVHPHLLDDPELVTRFRSRTKELLSLKHPAIAPVYDARLDQDALYAVTAVPAGESLVHSIVREAPLEVDDVLSIASQLAGALDYAHEHGIIHADLQPANVYVERGTVTLTGFLLLEAVETSPTFMAPEQLDETSGQIPDVRSDVYSMGAILYALLTGRPPFEGTSTEVAAAHLTQRPLQPRVLNPDLLPALDAILLKALAKQPHSRYQSVEKLMGSLWEAVHTAQTRRMGPDTLYSRSTKTISRRRLIPLALSSPAGIPTWAWVGLGIFLLVVTASAILILTG